VRRAGASAFPQVARTGMHVVLARASMPVKAPPFRSVTGLKRRGGRTQEFHPSRPTARLFQLNTAGGADIDTSPRERHAVNTRVWGGHLRLLGMR